MNDFKEQIKFFFMTCMFLDLPKKTRKLDVLERICVNRLKLYRLLQEAAHKFKLYSAEWEEYLVKGISETELLEFLGLLDRNKFKECQEKSVVEAPIASAAETQMVSETSVPQTVSEKKKYALLVKKDLFIETTQMHERLLDKRKQFDESKVDLLAVPEVKPMKEAVEPVAEFVPGFKDESLVKRESYNEPKVESVTEPKQNLYIKEPVSKFNPEPVTKHEMQGPKVYLDDECDEEFRSWIRAKPNLYVKEPIAKFQKIISEVKNEPLVDESEAEFIAWLRNKPKLCTKEAVADELSTERVVFEGSKETILPFDIKEELQFKKRPLCDIGAEIPAESEVKIKKFKEESITQYNTVPAESNILKIKKDPSTKFMRESEARPKKLEKESISESNAGQESKKGFFKFQRPSESAESKQKTILKSQVPHCFGMENLTISDSFEEYVVDDQTGHFIFALIASTSDELNKLFINLEEHWFQLKFSLNVPERYVIKYLRLNGIKFEKATKGEILGMKDSLSFYDLDCEVDTPVIYKLPLARAPNLIANREVLLKGGFMYFPKKHRYVSLFLQHFLRTEWKEKIKKLSKYWMFPDRDERMVELVKDFMPAMRDLLHYTGEIGKGILTLATIDDHSFKLFPLCMSELHSLLREKNHLKHFARFQYAVFLKNAGMSFPNAMELFMREFTKKMTEQEFRKEKYHYYFSHCYGKVGGKIDYPASTCEDVMSRPPTADQRHGCPFAHATDTQLTNILQSHDVNLTAVHDILQHKKKQEYGQACRRFFYAKLGSNIEYVTSPNSYYVCALKSCEEVDIEDIFM